MQTAETVLPMDTKAHLQEQEIIFAAGIRDDVFSDHRKQIHVLEKNNL